MRPDRFSQIKEIFRAAMQFDPEERSAFLEKACRDDRALREEVDKLLAAEEGTEGFLEKPAVAAFASTGPGENLVGRTIGRFQIKKIISTGGMGTVYEAVQEKPERTVAVKVMKQNLLSPGAQRRFEYEAQILARLRHANIAQVIEAGTYEGEGCGKSGDLSYFAMEYIPNALSLTEYAALKDLSFRERLGLFLQVCDAVHYGHQKGIIHRDLKPGNILVDAAGRIKIIDFGVARVTDADLSVTTARTEVGQLIGTLQYMSPEQCAADPDKMDTRTDVYSLGVVLYELLCEELPYDLRQAAIIEAARLIQEEPPRRPSAINRYLRGEVETIVLKALEKQQHRRYQSVADFGEDIGRHLKGEVIRARPAGAVRRMWKWIKRNPKVSSAGGVAGVSIVAFLAYVLLWSYPRIQAERNKVSAAYDRIMRLSDVKLLSQLEREADDLWPAHPGNIDKMKSWISRTGELLGNLPLHRRTLETLRTDALPYDEEAARHDRESHPQRATLLKLMKDRQRIEADIAALETKGAEVEGDPSRGGEKRPGSPDGKVDLVLRDLAHVKTRIRILEAEMSKRRTWEFKYVATRWEHDLLSDLVSKLESLADWKTGLLENVRKRLSFAGKVKTICIEDHGEEWDRAVASIADRDECPQYDGFVMEPRIGFVPIGRDPVSGLWEFAHLQTGEIAARGGDGRLLLSEETGLVFVLIPGGSFRMGSMAPTDESPAGLPNVDPRADFNAEPVHEVSVKPFLLSKYEMTQGQWLRFTGGNPSQHAPPAVRGGREINLLHPVEMVSWQEAWQAAVRLNLRLPSEAEWEYAARAGTSSIWWTGNLSVTLADAANICDQTWAMFNAHRGRNGHNWSDGHAVHAPVGLFRPNRFGLHDLHGNVYEWCWDTYLSSYNGTPVDGTPFESEHLSPHKVLRGGSWNHSSFNCRSAYRSYDDWTNRHHDLGLRPAASLQD